MQVTQFFHIGKIILIGGVFLILAGCGPATRTADGDCYYRGKGLLSVGATLLDGVVAYADAELEAAYQRDQIELQQLSTQLNKINPDNLHSENDIFTYNNAVDRHNLLLDRIENYQRRKQQEIEDGPRKSFSKQVDESGDC